MVPGNLETLIITLQNVGIKEDLASSMLGTNSCAGGLIAASSLPELPQCLSFNFLKSEISVFFHKTDFVLGPLHLLYGEEILQKFKARMGLGSWLRGREIG